MAKPKNLAKKLANAGERHKLADRYLSKTQLAQRQLNKRLDTEVAPGLTNRLVARQATADTKLRYGQQEADLLKQQAQIPQMAARDRSFFDDYVARINAAKVQAGVDTQNAVDAVGNLGQSLDDSSARNWGAQQAQMQTDAQARGATVDPNLAQIAKNASTVRSGLTGSYGAMLASQGANTQNAYANRALVGVQQGGEQARVRDQEVADMAKRILELHGEQGAYNTSRRSEIASSAADTALKNASTQSLIGDRAADNARADKTASRSASQWSSTVNKYGVTQGAWKDWGKTPTGKAKRAAAIKASEKNKSASTKEEKPRTGPGSLSPVQEQKQLSSIRKVAQVFSNGTYAVKTVDKYNQPVVKTLKGFAAIKRQLRAENVDPYIVDIAESLYRNKGKLGPYGIKQAQKLGVHVSGNFEAK